MPGSKLVFLFAAPLEDAPVEPVDHAIYVETEVLRTQDGFNAGQHQAALLGVMGERAPAILPARHYTYAASVNSYE